MIKDAIPISARTVISYAMKYGHPFLSLFESQWKLKQQPNQNLPMKEKNIVGQIYRRNKYINRKDQDCESYSQGSE